MTKAIILSLAAAHRFIVGASLNPDWANTFDLLSDTQSIATVRLGDFVYLFRADETDLGASIVIKIERGALFDGFLDLDGRLEALRRCVQAGIHALENGGQLPDYWRPFSGGRYITFQAQPISKNDQRRIAMLRSGSAPNGYAYIFAVTRTQRDYDNLSPDIALATSALRGRAEALSRKPTSTPQSVTIGTDSVDLETLPEQVDTVVQGWKLPYLYESKLTKKQKDFVDIEMDRPIRLKGAAGTGKTLAMVAKLLKEASKRKTGRRTYRFLFLTHNSSAAELAMDYAMALDVEDLIYSTDPDEYVRIDTLLSLAIRELSDDLGDLRPISNDANEGKRLQLIILSDVLKKFRDREWITYRKNSSENVRAGVEADVGSDSHEQFCWDIMNEIACRLDADGVRDNQVKREAYVRESKRPQYLMPLESEHDRQVLLALYDLYRDALRHEGLIAVDQLIADYLGYLDSFRWDARRARLGYDAVFVDEYHLFSRTERATFKELLRNMDVPILLMALDPRQSPKAFFLEQAFGGNEQPVPLASGHGKLVRDFEFNDVFRYTPEIARLLNFVSVQFPENDLSEEWLPGLATSALPSGDTPIAREYASQIELYVAAVAEGERLQKLSGKGKVALITLSRKSFDLISQAGRFDNRIYVLDSRESLNRLQYAGSKIVFSMPEYVAGVQFDHVLVADANELDDIGRPTTLARIRFGSSLYLAASRARRSVSIFANRQFRGLAPSIKKAIEQGLIIQQV